MNIREIHENKKQFLPLLLLADEQEDMIDHYLERGTMDIYAKVKYNKPWEYAFRSLITYLLPDLS